MHNNKMAVFHLFLLVAILSSAPVYAVLDIGAAIDKAGQQRMLSQRIVKAYFMLAADVNAGDARRQLDSSLAYFEKNLLDLKAYRQNETIGKSLEELELKWNQFRLSALAVPDRNKAAQFIKAGEEMLMLSQSLVDSITAYAQLDSAKIVATSGRQRMLTQRMAKYYVAYYYGLKNKEIVDAFHQAKVEYEEGLQQLNAYGGNTNEIRTHLNNINSQWAFSKKGMEAFPDEQELLPFIITVTTESMLDKMNDLTRIYTQLANNKEKKGGAMYSRAE